MIKTTKTIFKSLFILSIILYFLIYNQLENRNLISSFSKPKIEINLLITDYQNDTLKEYKIIHNDIMAGKKPLKLTYNGYTMIGGYANKLYSMLSSLVIALLTDSAIIIRWVHINSFIKEPFNMSFYNFDIKKDEFNVEYNRSLFYVPTKSEASWYFFKHMDLLIKTEIPMNFTRYHYWNYDPIFYEICSNPSYYSKLYYYGLVSKETVLNAYETTRNMSQHSREIKQKHILKVPFEVGGNLLNKMWIPNDFLLEKINYYLKNKFSNYFVIGIQLRFEYIIDPIDTYKFINCSLDIEKNLTSYDKEFSSKYKGIKWFLTSDTNLVIKRLSNEYPDKIIKSDGHIGHVEQDRDAYERSIIDVELLSKCNEIIITGGSTFGWIAAMKMLKLPYYINGGHNYYINKCLKTDLDILPITNQNKAVV
jgi:hypothetical protein